MASAWCEQFLSYLVPNGLHAARLQRPTNTDNAQLDEMHGRARFGIPIMRGERAQYPQFAESVIIDMAALHLAENPLPKEPKSLFGPSLSKGRTLTDEKLGAVVSGPEVGPDVVTDWATQSKQPIHATTTLQALVNLKRPSLHLSPLHPVEADSEDTPASHATHGLEFGFDCDAPKCQISIFATDSTSDEEHLVFQSTVDGGFGRLLKLEDGAALDLLKLENKPKASTADLAQPGPSSSTPALPTSNAASSVDVTMPKPSRKRISVMPFRKRGRPDVSGPALQVVDMEKPTDEADKEIDSQDQGVRLAIHLEAFTEHGQPLTSRNLQTTYLRVVRLGTPTPSSTDARPWVVTVVRRDATIGTHTFRLHEIYGFSSSDPSSSAPATASTEPSHSYPPVPTPDPKPDEAASECVLCLSSPREVVLLPCRHLVACKECAINMVEFGAGGQVHHTEATEVTEASEGAAGAATEGEGEGEAAVAVDGAATTTAADATPGASGATAPVTPSRSNRHRRKRKAKGWFCPVCRQPYTSLLRISATAPDQKTLDEAASAANSRPISLAHPLAQLEVEEGAEGQTQGAGGLSGMFSSARTRLASLSTSRSGADAQSRV